MISREIMLKTADPYAPVKVELDAALDARDPKLAAAACRRAQLALARIASGPGFDPRRHRAIATALRDMARGGGPAEPCMPSGDIAPLSTRGAR